VYRYSNQSLESFSAYSMLEDPMTSCGCFECIATILPGTNGVMIVDREFEGMTPSGMTFSTLAQSVGGGVQTPGFIGIGTLYILSRKFISADGGLKRVVWLSSNIKAKLGERLFDRAQQEGEPDLPDKIADETITTDLGELAEYLISINHPALQMEEMI